VNDGLTEAMADPPTSDAEYDWDRAGRPLVLGASERVSLLRYDLLLFFRTREREREMGSFIHEVTPRAPTKPKTLGSRLGSLY
jgi:hypothetical protein